MWLALDGFGGGWLAVAMITSITTTGGLIAMIVWTYVGGSLVDYVGDERRGKIVFRTLGAMLLLLGCVMAIQGL